MSAVKKPSRGHSQTLNKEFKKRKKYVCQECGSNKNLHVHHKDRNTTNNSFKNLMLLCRKCHMIKHSMTDKEKLEKALFYRKKMSQIRKEKKEKLVISCMMKKFKKRKYLITADVCSILNVSRQRVHQLKKEGVLRCTKIGGRWYFVDEIDRIKTRNN